MPILLIKKSLNLHFIDKEDFKFTFTTPASPRLGYNIYSHGKMLPRWLAPAIPQGVAFYLTLPVITFGIEATFQKKRALLSFQIFLEARRRREERSLRR